MTTMRAHRPRGEEDRMAVQNVAGAQRTAAPFSIRTIALPLAAIVLGTFMAILDNTVVNVALPTLERFFKVDLHQIQWVVTGYMLAQAAVIPLSGWLGDRFGAKRLYLISISLFALGSALCAVAPSSTMLIAFRVLQGLGGGMLMPIGMSFIYRLSPPDRRGMVMGMFGIPILLAPALGPVLSGWLVQYADWRWIFLINVPVAVVAVALGLRALPDLGAQRAVGALDTLGALLAPFGFAAASYGISESTTAGWTGTSTLLSLAVGAVALIAFAVRELTTAAPLLELRVFRGRDFSLAIVTQWVGQAALFGALFLVPLFLQQVRGYGAFDTGLFTLPQAIAAGVFMPIGGRLFDRIGVRVPVILGLVLVTVSTWFLAQITATTTGEDLRWVLAMRGAGMGLMMMPLSTYILNSAPRNLVSRVTSLTSALQNVVGSLAIAGLATILQRQVAAHMATARSATALHNAAATAFDNTFMVAAVAAAVGVLLALTLRRWPAGAPTVAEAGTTALQAAPQRTQALLGLTLAVMARQAQQPDASPELLATLSSIADGKYPPTWSSDERGRAVARELVQPLAAALLATSVARGGADGSGTTQSAADSPEGHSVSLS
jgi:EmrB/QacA subfamily drug resistance transporter